MSDRPRLTPPLPSFDGLTEYTYSIGKTTNIGNFESIRVDVGGKIDATVPDAFNKLVDEVYQLFEECLDEAIAEEKQKKEAERRRKRGY
jgi:hypothetical protein